MSKSFNKFDKDAALDLINKITSQTKHYAVVNIEGESEGVTRFANSEISQNTNKQDLNVYLTLHDGTKEVTCTTNVLDETSIKKFVQDAENLLAAAPNGDFERFPWQLPGLITQENNDDLAEIYSVRGRADLLKECVEKIGTEYSAAGALTLTNRISAYGNSDSKKDILYSNQNNVTFNTVVTHIVGNADGGGEAVSHKVDGLESAIKAAFVQAKDRAALAINPINVTDKRFTVVLSPAALGDLVLYITLSLNAKRVLDGLSFCGSDVPTEQIFGKNVTITDDVTNPKLPAKYFDYEGNKRQVLPLIEGGFVKNLIFDNKTAKRMNAAPTGHAFYNGGYGGYSANTIMTGGETTQDEIIKSVKKGLFISEFHYTNFVNPATMLVTGLTRNGTFLIENGEVTKSVSNLRFTQNIIEAFNNITALSKDLHVINSIGTALMPSAKIERFAFP
ncbi:MAG: TldD/PmbA family protein [Defluviitaleaceae bacterium]|nr:TldD/PmbA family protein [Defluviitaleaceae bacterium]